MVTADVSEKFEERLTENMGTFNDGIPLSDIVIASLPVRLLILSTFNTLAIVYAHSVNSLWAG